MNNTTQLYGANELDTSSKANNKESNLVPDLHETSPETLAVVRVKGQHLHLTIYVSTFSNFS